MTKGSYCCAIARGKGESVVSRCSDGVPLGMVTTPPHPPQDLVKASQAVSKLTLELEGSRASEAQARREVSSSKADLAAALAREEGAVSRLREVEEAAARRRGELEGRLAAAEEACREGAGAATAAAREEEVARSRAKLAEVVARRDEKVRRDGEDVGGLM